MSLDQTTPLTVRIRYQLSQARLAFLQAIYQLNVPQRILIVGGILLMLPAYWTFRLSSYQILNFIYAEDKMTPRPSFTESLPLQATNASILPTQDGSYMAYLTISNPNPDLAVDKANLEFSTKDSGGTTVHSSGYEFYLLPGQKRLFVIPKFISTTTPISSKIDITNVHLQKRFEIPTIEIEAQRPGLGTETDYGSEQLIGSLVNKSPYTLGKVEIVYIFFNKANSIIGTAQRMENSVRPEEKREFPIPTGDLPGTTIERIETNVFSNPLDARNLTSR